MSLFRKGKRLGALAFALGAALVGPIASGVAAATPDDGATTDSTSTPAAAAGIDELASVKGVNTIASRSSASRSTTAAVSAPVTPEVLGQTDDGRIIGFLLATDPEADYVTYTLAQSPQHGTIQFDDSGVWTYTPGDDFTGTDSFYVMVDDPGLHLNIAQLFANSALVTVDITTPK